MKLNKCNASGTSLMGYITTDYATLTGLFGHPHFSDGDKVTAEWCFETDFGTVFTIYDYKEEKTPLDVYAWHIGGKSPHAVTIVKAILEEAKIADTVEMASDYNRRKWHF